MKIKKQAAFPVTALLWLDKELNLGEQEFQELEGLKEFVDTYNSMAIPHSVLPRKKIDIRKSTLFKKLISHGYCILGLSEIELRKKHSGNDNDETLQEYIERRYREISGISGTPFPPFPSGVFMEMDDDPLEIYCDDLSSYNHKRLLKEKGLIKIHFGEMSLPDILCFSPVIPKLKDICFFKIREHLAHLSGDNPQFYSIKMQQYKNLLKGRNLELVEMEIGKLKSTTEKQTREDITRIIIDRISRVEGIIDYFVSEIASSENNFILTRFTIDNRGDFDFFQSIYLLQKGLLSHRQHHTVNNANLLQAIKQSLSGFVTTEELRENALKANPEMTRDEYDEIFRNFEESCVGLSTKLPMPLLMKQAIPKGDMPPDHYLVHVGNLNTFIETRLIKASEDIRDSLKTAWKKKLTQHAFDEGMFSDAVFRKQLDHILETGFYSLYCFLNNPQLDSFLDAAGLLSPRVQLLRDTGADRPDVWLKIERQELYDSINQAIIAPLSQFSRIFFHIMHWLYHYFFIHRPEKERKKEALPKKKEVITTPIPDETAVHRLLQHCSCKTDEKLKEQIQDLWQRIPEKNLAKEDVDQNILRDLNSFFTDKEIVYYPSLEFIIETNLNRILSRGPHLIPYSATLREYIENQICYTIYLDSYMRNKIRFRKQ